MAFTMPYHSTSISSSVGRRLKWQERGSKSRKVHGWIATEADFNRSGLVADHPRQHGFLKSVDDVMQEEARKVADLSVQLEAKNRDIYELECKYNATALSLDKTMEDTIRITQAYHEG